MAITNFLLQGSLVRSIAVFHFIIMIPSHYSLNEHHWSSSHVYTVMIEVSSCGFIMIVFAKSRELNFEFT